MTIETTKTSWTTYGITRGMGPVRSSRSEAERDMTADMAACLAGSSGAYSDRRVYAVDAEGYLRDERGGPVWPQGGRSAGAVRIEGGPA